MLLFSCFREGAVLWFQLNQKFFDICTSSVVFDFAGIAAGQHHVNGRVVVWGITAPEGFHRGVGLTFKVLASFVRPALSGGGDSNDEALAGPGKPLRELPCAENRVRYGRLASLRSQGDGRRLVWEEALVWFKE